MPEGVTVYRVKDWVKFFESSQSRRYGNKSQCYMPVKQGKGYKRIMKREDGPAIYGAWCAMIQSLSRQDCVLKDANGHVVKDGKGHPVQERHGWLTDDGKPTGTPLTPDDVSIDTLMPLQCVSTMFDVCASVSVGWMESYTQTQSGDTALQPHSAYPLPLPLPLPLPTPSQPPEPECGGGLCNCYGMFETEIVINALSPVARGQIHELHEAGYSCDLIQAAIPEAVRANHRSISYVGGICKRCAAEGRMPGDGKTATDVDAIVDRVFEESK